VVLVVAVPVVPGSEVAVVPVDVGTRVVGTVDTVVDAATLVLAVPVAPQPATANSATHRASATTAGLGDLRTELQRRSGLVVGSIVVSFSWCSASSAGSG